MVPRIALLCILVIVGLFVSVKSWRIHGINYSPVRGTDWDPNRCKSPEEVNKDIKTLKIITDRVRIYSIQDCDQGRVVINAAKKNGMKVWLGMWVSKDISHFDKEKTALETLLKERLVDSNAITGIHVGSEGLYRGDYSSERIIGYINDVRTLLSQYKVHGVQVTTADIRQSLHEHWDVIKEVDVISMNTFPFWEQVFGVTPIWNLKRRLGGFKKYKKQLMISETGWASEGSQQGMFIEASEKRQAEYFRDFVCLMAKYDNIPYYYYSAFDQPWRLLQDKQDDGAEGSFGLFYENGKIKPYIENLEFDCKGVDPKNPFEATAPQKPLIGAGSTSLLEKSEENQQDRDIALQTRHSIDTSGGDTSDGHPLRVSCLLIFSFFLLYCNN